MHKAKLTLLFLPLLILAVLSPQALCAASGERAYTITDETIRQRIGKGVFYFEDTTLQKDLQQIQQLYLQGEFTRFDSDTLNMGYRNGAMWFKFSVKSSLNTTLSSIENQHLFLTIRYPLLDDIQLFQINDGKTIQLQLGDLKPFEERFYSIPSFVFPLIIPANTTVDYYLRVSSSSSVSLPLFVETEKSFIETQHKFDVANGTYFGITIGLCIYNLFLWLGVRKKIYGLYVIAVLNLLLFNANLSGYGYQLWPESVKFQQISLYAFSASAGIAVCFFGMAFLKTRKLQPRIHKTIQFVVVFYLIGLPAMFTLPSEYAAKLNAVTLFFGVIILLIASLRSFLKGYRPAIYYLIGQGAVLFGVLFTVLASQGVISYLHHAADVMKWSSAFELIFFSMGLADLVNHERRLRTKAEKAAIKVQKAMLEAEVSKNEQLDSVVRQRTEELEKANRRLEELNTIDELTGLKNRRYLNQVLPAEYQRAFREKQPLSLLMFDIDHFKNLNDTYGHQFGDLCLTTAGDIIRSNIRRPPDIGVRYGGEEFLVVLPSTDLDGAKRVAEKIRNLFETTTVSDDQHSVNMTISVGIASGIPTIREGYEARLKLADDMLYVAKENGRNQVVCCQEQKETSSNIESKAADSKPTH